MGKPLTTLCDVIDTLEQAGDKPAIIEMTADGAVDHSRQTLLDAVNRLAAGLEQRGIRPGEVVALLGENRLEWIVSALGVIRCGAIILPVDSQTGDENLRHILEDSGARLVLTNAEHAERVRSAAADRSPPIVRIDDREQWRALSADRAPEPASPAADDYAVLFYTSGTTGPPKGVPLTHHNVVLQLQALEQVELVTARDRVLLPLPLHHVYPFVMGMLVPQYLGLPTILPKSLTGPEILRAIREGGVTAIAGVPRLYRALESGIASQIDQQKLPARLYLKGALALSTVLRGTTGVLAGKKLLAPLHRRFGASLRLLASGGSLLDASLARKLEGLGWEIGIGYGLTETSPLLTVNLPGSGKPGSVGHAVPGVELKIEPARTPDADAGERRPGRQAGELLARGPNVFGGYWNAPDKTREAFTGDGWFRTGDLGYFDKHGYLYLQGRASTLIVTESGKNIQPEEVEARYAQHPWIEEIGVLEDAGRLAALVIPRVDAVRHSGHTEQDAIKTAVAEQSRKLPSYQRLAEYATSREALPRTRLGKIQRHRLAERYRAARKSGQDRDESPAGPIGLEEMSDQDRALVEEPAARQVWQWLAERYPEARLTPDTSPYMDLNIDSIEMINLTLEIKRLTGVELDEPAIAGVETVRDLLQVIVQQAETGGGAGLDPERILTEPEAYLSDEQKRWLKPLSPGRVLLARSAHLLIGILLRVFFRLRVRGTQNLPAGQRFVLTPNHVSVLDPVVLYAAMPFSLLRNTWFAGWTGMVFKNTGMRFVARTGQTVPIDPRRAAASSLALGATVLKKDRDLVWFPEGERARDGRLKPFKTGIGLLLKHYPVQAVPVHIHGTYEAMPRGNRFPRLRPITITFGAPLDPQSLEDGEDEPAQDRISRRLHDYVAQLARLDSDEAG